jgi:hypothetical protein
MSGPRGLHLSGTQVIASVLATLTGAIAASYLGVGGTLVGAAVGSISSTMGTEIYRHYLQRSQERLRTAGQGVLHHPGARTGTGTTVSGTTASSTAPGATVGGRPAASAGPASRPAAGGEAEHDTAVWDHRQYGAPRDPHQTELIPGVATEWGVPSDWSASGGSTNGGTTSDGSPYGRTTAGGSAANGGGRPGDTASSHAHGQLTDDGPAGDDAGAGGLWGAVTSFFAGLTRRQWLTYGGTAALFFAVVVAAIIVFQLIVGGPVLGKMSGPFSGHQPATHSPSTSPATPAGSTPASPTSSASTASGTPTPSSGTPSPGTSGTASSPSTVPSPTPSAGSSGAVRSTTLVTPTP